MAAITRFNLREHWRELRRGRPGHRFQERYERARAEQRCGAGERVVLIILAVLFLSIALILSVFPGPALPFFFLAGGLLASESRFVARFMDWSEVRTRKIAAWLKRQWRRLPATGRIAVLAFGASCSLATAYLGYRIITG